MTSFSSSAHASARPPSRGEVWLADLDPVRGHEQSGRRPVLIVSGNRLNRGLSGLVIILPMTTRIRGIPSHVPVQPPEGGLLRESVAMCEQIRSVAVERLLRPLGALSVATFAIVEDELRGLLNL